MAEGVTYETGLPRTTRLPWESRRPLVIAVANQKGGVGKTSSVVNVSAVLALRFGARVLVIDLDPQGHAALSLGVGPVPTEETISAALLARRPLEEVIVRTSVENLDVVPSNEDLAAAEDQISRQPGREAVLRRLIERSSIGYDFVFVDTPPNLGVLTFNALYASRFALVPIQPRLFSIDGLRRLYHVIELLRGRLNAELAIIGHFLTMVDNRYKITHEVREDLRSRLGGMLMRTEIPSSVRLEEGHFLGKPCVIYAPDSNVAKAYHDLTVELLERVSTYSAGDTPIVGRPTGGIGIFSGGVDKTV